MATRKALTTLLVTATFVAPACIPLENQQVASRPIRVGQDSGLALLQDATVGGIYLEDISARLSDTVISLAPSTERVAAMLRFPYLYGKKVSWSERPQGYRTVTLLQVPPGKYRLVGYFLVRAIDGVYFVTGSLQASRNCPVENRERAPIVEVRPGAVTLVGALRCQPPGLNCTPQLDASPAARAEVLSFLETELAQKNLEPKQREMLRVWHAATAQAMTSEGNRQTR